ncbi:MAG: TspO/MBR family protein [Bacteroidota bacterium]
MAVRILIFALLNFGALALGSLFTGKGVPSEWYQALNKAPWTPPGWVFGAAWFSIMICFTIYMALIWKQTDNQNLLISLFIIQWVLNVSWNPVFFSFHLPSFGLIIITLLTALMAFFLLFYWPKFHLKSLLVLPYVIWLIIATSLNAFIWLKN